MHTYFMKKETDDNDNSVIPADIHRVVIEHDISIAAMRTIPSQVTAIGIHYNISVEAMRAVPAHVLGINFSFNTSVETMKAIPEHIIVIGVDCHFSMEAMRAIPRHVTLLVLNNIGVEVMRAIPAHIQKISFYDISIDAMRATPQQIREISINYDVSLAAVHAIPEKVERVYAYSSCISKPVQEAVKLRATMRQSDSQKIILHEAPSTLTLQTPINKKRKKDQNESEEYSSDSALQINPTDSVDGFRLSLDQKTIDEARLKIEFKKLNIEYILESDHSSKQFSNLGLRIARIKKLEKIIGPDRAWGVLTDCNIKVNTLIAKYTGENLDYHAADERSDKSYFIKVSEDHFVDAKMQGGVARFINGSINANCEFRIVANGTQNEVMLYSTRMIATGEQLLANYGDAYENYSDSRHEEKSKKKEANELVALLPHDTDLSPKQKFDAHFTAYASTKSISDKLLTSIHALAEECKSVDQILNGACLPADFAKQVRPESTLAPNSMELMTNRVKEKDIDAPLFIIEKNATSFKVCDDNQPNLTTLMLACFNNDLKSVQALLKKNANANAQTLSGKTPLIFVILCKQPKDQPEIIRTLIQHHADPCITDPYHRRTVLHYCVILDKVDCLQAILTSTPMIRSEFIQPILFCTIENNNWKMAEMLLQTLIKNSCDWNNQEVLRKNALKEWKSYFQKETNPLNILRLIQIAKLVISVETTASTQSKFVTTLKRKITVEESKAQRHLNYHIDEHLKSYVSADNHEDLRSALVEANISKPQILSTLIFAIETDHLESANILISHIHKLDIIVTNLIRMKTRDTLKNILKARDDESRNKIYLALKDTLNSTKTTSRILNDLNELLLATPQVSVYSGSTSLFKNPRSTPAKTHTKAQLIHSKA